MTKLSSRRIGSALSLSSSGSLKDDSLTVTDGDASEALPRAGIAADVGFLVPGGAAAAKQAAVGSTQWTYPYGGVWTVASNWSAGVPTSTLDATIGPLVGGDGETLSYAVTLTTTGAAHSLTVLGGIHVTLNIASPAKGKSAKLAIQGNLSNAGYMQVDPLYGGSALTVGGTLTNTFTLNIGNVDLAQSTTVTAASLVNTGIIYLQGNTTSGTKNRATLDITAGTAPSVWHGLLLMQGDALLEFAGGQITSIGSDGDLILNTANGFIADAADTSSNSALTGLTSNSGTLDLDHAIALQLPADFTNWGALYIDHNYTYGGSSLTIGGTLTNTGNIDIGSDGESSTAATTLSVANLTNSGSIRLFGGTYPNTNQSILSITGAATDSGSIALYGLSVLKAGSLTVTNGRTISVASGGMTSGVNIGAGGSEVVSAGGTASGTTVGSGGTLELLNGAILAGTTTIAAGGIEEIGSGYTVNGFVVSSGVTLEVASGGTASGTVVQSGGTLELLGGAILAGTTAVKAGGTEAIGAGYTVNGFVVSSGVTLEVLPGGTASATIVNNGGSAIVYGTVTGGKINSGGRQIVEAGAVLRGATISGGLLEVASGGSVGPAPITFAGGGTLQLDSSTNITPTIAGFAIPDQLDLRDIAFVSGTTTETFKEAVNNASGTLTISDGKHTAKLTLLGTYVTSQFQLGGDSHGGTLVTDPPVAAGPSQMSFNDIAPDQLSGSGANPGDPTNHLPVNAVATDNLAYGAVGQTLFPTDFFRDGMFFLVAGGGNHD